MTQLYTVLKHSLPRYSWASVTSKGFGVHMLQYLKSDQYSVVTTPTIEEAKKLAATGFYYTTRHPDLPKAEAVPEV